MKTCFDCIFNYDSIECKLYNKMIEYEDNQFESYPEFCNIGPCDNDILSYIIEKYYTLYKVIKDNQ